MQWDAGKNLGFSSAPAKALYLPVDPSKDAPTVAGQQADPSSLWHCVQALLALRQESPALTAKGKITLLRASYPTVFLRSSGRSRYLVAVQPAARDFTMTLKLSWTPHVSCLRLAEGMDATLAKGRSLTISGTGKSFGIWKL